MKKTILITGSTDGIGKLAALEMAKEGHHIYVHGRNEMKVAKVIDELKTQSNNKQIDGFVADFSDLDNVRQMAKDVRDKISHIDVLINNAGVFKSPQPITKSGVDIRMVVNYFAPYLFTTEILDLIKKSSHPRLINLSSAAQSSVSQNLLNGTQTVSDQEAYAQSKLAILMWSFYLSEQEPDICVLALNPGSLLNTNMVKEAYGRFWSSAEKGGDIIFDLALSNEYKDMTGKYFDNDKGSFGPAHPDAYDKNMIADLIKSTDGILAET